jgi:chain length determinant protein EpsF
MNARQLVRILLARWWVVVLVLGTMVGATAAVSALLPRQYTATATMVIEPPKATDVLGGVGPGVTVAAQTHMATQIDVLSSERVAREVVKLLGIDRSASTEPCPSVASRHWAMAEAHFAGLLTKSLDVKPSRESSVVSITFTGTEPNFAAQVANAFAKAYIATNVELRNQPSKLYATWFDEQLKNLRAETEQAQARVSAYQQRHGIVSGDERLDVENARLAELSQQLALAQTQAVDARSRSQVGTPSVRSLPEVGLSPVVQGLRTDLVRAETRLQQVSEHMGPAHPTRERLEAEIASLRERLEQELRNASGSVATVSTGHERRVNELRQLVAVQKQRLLETKVQRDEMQTLMREADNAKRVFEIALQRLAQNRLESQNTQPNAYVLNEAAAPSTPSSPKVRRNVMLSAVLGLMLGLAAALLVEVVDRRIRSAQDLEAGAQLVVFGSLPRSKPRAARTLGWNEPTTAAQGV